MLADPFLLILNVLSTVSIVFVNKSIFQTLPFAMLLTLCHQAVSGAIVILVNHDRQGKKSIPWQATWWWAFLCVSGIYIQNLSLRMNTVTLYQIAKLMTIPVQCLYQYLVRSKVYTLYVYGSLAVLTVGVGLSTSAELNVRVTLVGVIIAAAGVALVVLEQGESSRLLEKYEIGAQNFLCASALPRIVLSAMAVLAVERDALVLALEISWQHLCYVFMSCLLATSIHFTSAYTIYTFGPVTQAVLGHLKTLTILMGGLCLQSAPLDVSLAKNILTGFCIALTGAIKYGQYTKFPEADCLSRCRREKRA